MLNTIIFFFFPKANNTYNNLHQASILGANMQIQMQLRDKYLNEVSQYCD
jgi:hypothetical protein